MKAQTNLKDAQGRVALLTILALATLLIVAITFIVDEAHYYSLKEDLLGRFYPFKWWLVGHLSGGIIALLIGPFQFWSTFRNKYIKIHRRLGRIYLIAILVGALSSTFLAWNTAILTHWTWAFSLQILGLVWFTTAFMAYRAIRKRRIQQHREWMIRSYVVTFAFIAFRYINNSDWMVELGNFVERAPTVAWAVWAIPLFFTEVIFQWNKKN